MSTSEALTSTDDAIRAAAARIAAAGDSEPRLARDPVNLPMIRTWLEAIGTRPARTIQTPTPRPRP